MIKKITTQHYNPWSRRRESVSPKDERGGRVKRERKFEEKNEKVVDA